MDIVVSRNKVVQTQYLLASPYFLFRTLGIRLNLVYKRRHYHVQLVPKGAATNKKIISTTTRTVKLTIKYEYDHEGTHHIGNNTMYESYKIIKNIDHTNVVNV